MAGGERSCSAPTSISCSRGGHNITLAEKSVETITVSGHLHRETCSSRSCPWGMDCVCLVMGAFCFGTHQVL